MRSITEIIMQLIDSKKAAIIILEHVNKTTNILCEIILDHIQHS